MDRPRASALNSYKRSPDVGSRRSPGAAACYRLGMRNSMLLGSAVLSSTLLFSALSFGHTELVSPPPREDAGCNGTVAACKTAPCGGQPPGDPYVKVGSNGKLSVTYQETINHNGCFVVELSKTGNDDNFIPLNVAKDNSNKQSHTVNIQLDGGFDCQFCTLRVRQMMMATTPTKCDPNAVPDQGTYYQCADIQIGTWPDGGRGSVDGGTGGDDGGASGEDGGTSDMDAGTVGTGDVDAGGTDFGDNGDGLPPGDSNGCTTSPIGSTSGATGLLAIVGLAFLRARRRRR